MTEQQILTSSAQDKIKQCENDYIVTHTAFLTMSEMNVVLPICRNHKNFWAFYGGYADAERCISIFFPDYIQLKPSDNLIEFLNENDDYNPLCLLRFEKDKFSKISHRDYLGALMGLGIERKNIGDILVSEKSCDIIVLKSIAKYILSNLERAGKASLKGEILPLERIIIPEEHFTERTDTVASLRIDNLLSAAFNTSRSDSAVAIEKGLVFINSFQVQKNDRAVKQGDKIVWRGKGKVILTDINGETKKGRISINLKIFK
ncbi:MAG: RNA-binding protein [Clostridiales bacterium]|nr:RNA-binding protein [Clostridiales bacterium]